MDCFCRLGFGEGACVDYKIQKNVTFKVSVMREVFLIFTGLVILAVVIKIAFFLINLKKLKRLKSQGEVDFIDEEYVEFLKSSEDNSFEEIKNVSVVFRPNKQNTDHVSATIYSSNFGVYVDFSPMFASMAIDGLFFFGKSYNKSFIPRIECYVYQIERKNGSLMVTGSFSKSKSVPKFSLEIKNTTFQITAVFEKLPVIEK
jgi:hypothetical protein